MTADHRTFYLTTPIYYINAAPHLGHAYTTIIADAMVRWRRLRGDDVFFLTGTDEHGDKISQAAAKAGVAPQALADTNSAAYREAWKQLGITNDDFIRTTEERHRRVVQDILQRLWDTGQIYLGTYGGHYCYGCERFYTEKEIVDGNCPDHQTALAWIEEENYFFKMSAYQGWLVDAIGRRPDLIQPERYRNEILGFLRDPLQDLSISRPRRRLEWGIPLPFDDTYVTYVWFDALINYVSALGGPGDPRFETYWPHAEHLIGKDIVKPHAIYWPCMLKALADALGRKDELLFHRLNVHGFWNIGGHKMSKSIGNVVEAYALKDKYGNDAFRYFVMREMVFGLDADFSEEAFVGRLNADLANDLGNLASRATTLIVNLGGGVVPIQVGGPDMAPHTPPTLGSGAAKPDRSSTPQTLGSGPAQPDRSSILRESWEKAIAQVGEAMDEYAFQRALASIWEFVREVNRYVDTTQPWALAKRPDARADLDATLYDLAESLRLLGIVLQPFIPDAATKIRAAVGARGQPKLADAVWGRLEAGTSVQKVSGLFPRVDDKARQAAAATAAGDGEATVSARIAKDEFGRVELRVADVVAAEAVPKSKKLLKLTVSLGTEQRTVVAGIAEHYAPGDLVGKKVVIVANLQPAKLMGVESNGMVLAGSADGKLAVLTIDRELPPGARVS